MTSDPDNFYRMNVGPGLYENDKFSQVSPSFKKSPSYSFTQSKFSVKRLLDNKITDVERIGIYSPGVGAHHPRYTRVLPSSPSMKIGTSSKRNKIMEKVLNKKSPGPIYAYHTDEDIASPHSIKKTTGFTHTKKGFQWGGLGKHSPGPQVYALSSSFDNSLLKKKGHPFGAITKPVHYIYIYIYLVTRTKIRAKEYFNLFQS